MALSLPRAFWPVTIVAGVNDKIYATDSTDLPFNITLAAGIYYSAEALRAEIQSKLQAVHPQWLASVSATGRFSIYRNGISYRLSRTSGYNLLLRSQEFDNAAWSKFTGVTVTANAVVGPDGTNTADQISYDGTGSAGTARWSQGAGVPLVGESRVSSLWLRAAAPLSLDIDVNISGGTGRVTMNITTTWQRFSTYGIGDGVTTAQLTVYSPGGINTAFSVYAWQGQHEPGTVPGTLALTTTATVTPTTLPLFAFLGFADNIYSASGLAVPAPYQHQNGWYAEDPVIEDTGDLAAYTRGQSRSLGGQTYSLDFSTVYDRLVRLGFLHGYKRWRADEGASHVNEALERLIDNGWMRLRWWPDQLVEGTYEDLVLDASKLKAQPRNRLSPGKALYSIDLPFMKYVP